MYTLRGTIGKDVRMGWISSNLGSILAGVGIILLLALVTRGNLRGSKAGVGGCANCTCGGGACRKQGGEETGAGEPEA